MKEHVYTDKDLTITVNDPTWIDVPVELIELCEKADYIETK